MGSVMHAVFTSSTAVVVFVMAVSCGDGPAGPSASAMNEFIEALRGRGMTVTIGEEIPPSVNGYFSVPARTLHVNSDPVNVFVYSNAERAAAQAREITPDAQPSARIHVSWVSTPRFYHQGSLIVLYLGCKQEILDALQATLGPPVATGDTPCFTSC